MKIKKGAMVAGISREMWYAAGVIDTLHKAMFQGTEAVVTSGTDGKHLPYSLHYKGLAIDIRTRDEHDKQVFFEAIKEALDPYGFDTVVETDHIHTEFQPKGGETFLSTTD